VTEGPRRPRGRVWAVPVALLAVLTLWVALVTLVLPDLLARAWRGEGPGWLSARLAGRGSIPLEEYLSDLRGLGLRVSAMLALFAGLAAAWARRGVSVTDRLLEPAPLRDLALARVVVTGLALVLLLWPGLPFMSLASDPAYQTLLTHAPAGLFDPPLALRLLLPGVGRPAAALLEGIWIVALASAVLGVVGALGRVPLLALAWANTVLVGHAYSYGEYHHPEALHAIALWLVAIAPSTRELSFDALRRRAREARARGRFEPRPGPLLSPHARWPLVLLALLFAVTYFDAAIEKLLGGGLSWFDPGTMAYYMAVDGTRQEMPIAIWLSRHLAFLAPLSAGSWAIEFLFPLALVSVALAPVLVLLAAAMHVAIWVIHGPPFLQHVVLLPVAFQEPLRRVWRRVRGPAPDRLRVLYDGHCDLCIRSMTILETLDATDRLEFLDLEDEKEAARLPRIDRLEALARMHVVDASGRVWRGFEAFRRLSLALPALWPAVPLLHAPGSGRLGPVIYDAIARRRNRRGCRLAA